MAECATGLSLKTAELYFIRWRDRAIAGETRVACPVCAAVVPPDTPHSAKPLASCEPLSLASSEVEERRAFLDQMSNPFAASSVGHNASAIKRLLSLSRFG